MKRILAVLLSISLCMGNALSVLADKEAEKEGGGKTLSPSAILMEASTGKVICEKAADEERPPASVTKIMTLLLIFDALDSGKITLKDEVGVSEYAASMGGSQVFLEAGEKQSVDTMIKCIAVASANDACVSMAEYISGSEEEFVERMNKRARGLGMRHTHFKNCNGLDENGHLTTARDIALMSRELITKYPKIRKYTMIWMENITHTTNKGSSEFGLTNTNKLVRQYEYATGLKTGSTGKAKFCVCATAEKDEIELIAVIMAAPDSKTRFKDAAALLNYGFGKCTRYTDEREGFFSVPVANGEEKKVRAEQREAFSYVDVKGKDLTRIKKKDVLKKRINAPVKRGERVGERQYYLEGRKIGGRDIVAARAVKKMSFRKALREAAYSLLL